MARTYGELVDLVRDWSNRDQQVLGDGVIQDCLKYAADKAYRILRVPPLEELITYNSTNLNSNTTTAANGLPSRTELAVPADLIEVVQIREFDANNTTTRLFSQKVDIRTFNDSLAEIGQYGSYWTRQQQKIILAPGFGEYSNGTPSGIEVYYYKRLPALNAKYNVTAANHAAGFLTSATQSTTGAAILYFSTINGVTTAYDTQAAATAAGGTQSNGYFVGNLVPNWLRDENERILLMGALAEVFFYLQDEEQAQKYATLFMNEIAELNDEDKKRNARGGNVQTNYYGGGLI